MKNLKNKMSKTESDQSTVTEQWERQFVALVPKIRRDNENYKFHICECQKPIIFNLIFPSVKMKYTKQLLKSLP